MRNSSRTWLMRENAAFASTIPNGSIVLDAGAGHQPYRHLLSHCQYEAADFEKVDKEYAKSTYVCALDAIPVEDKRFDAILFNQVMEHLPDPETVLKELKRVLKSGGVMLCTAPLFYEEHEQPYDFYRYTQFGWRYLMEKAGFEILRMEWMEGYFGTVAYQMHTAKIYLPFKPREIVRGLWGYLLSPILFCVKVAFYILAQLFYRIDEKSKYTNRGFPKNYLVIVRNPG